MNRKLRLLLVSALAALGAAQAVRSAVVAAYADAAPATAAKGWPNHPAVLISQALTAIGSAAAARQPPGPAALASLRAASRMAPLAPEPFLAKGITAQEAGDARLAEQAFLAAKLRAPREPAPRFLLAERYLARGDGARGLRELAALARLLPNGAATVAPALAGYVRQAPDLRPIKATFQDDPGLEQAVLLELAKDTLNAPRIFALAGNRKAPNGRVVDWVNVLIGNLVEAGEFDRARQVWADSSGAKPNAGLFDANFSGSLAPAPFNWTLNSDSRGIAEPDGAGGLRVTFYGREDAVLASQTAVLAPGRYRLLMSVSGQGGDLLSWSVTCLPKGQVGLNLPLSGGQGAGKAAEFTVAADCRAQRVDLRGSAPDLPQQADLTIRRLSLSRLANGQ